MSSESSDSKTSSSETKKEKPNLLPEQKLFWGTVENVFDSIGALFCVSAGVIGINFLWNMGHILKAHFYEEPLREDDFDNIYTIFSHLLALGYFSVLFIVAILITDRFHNHLGLLLRLSVASFFVLSILSYHVIQIIADFQFPEYSLVYPTTCLAIPLALLTSAFCTFALYKTRKIKIPRFYDGPDLYEVIYDAENSSTKWTRKLKSD